MDTTSTWAEQYDGGDAYTESDRLNALAARIMWVQKRLQERGHQPHIHRAFHAKIRLGVENARLEIRADLPEAYRVKFFQPDQKFMVTARLSNASGSIQHDGKRDMRGIALRVKVTDSEYHDFLLTNGPASHARDGNEFVAFAEALAGSRLKLPFRLMFNLGPFTTLRMIRTLLRNARSNIDSLATETYWSRGAMKWGSRAVRLKLAPVVSASPSPPPSKSHPDYLRSDLAERLRHGPVAFDLFVQEFVDGARTPIENAAVVWRRPIRHAPVARLVIPNKTWTGSRGRPKAVSISSRSILDHNRRLPTARPSPASEGCLLGQFCPPPRAPVL